MNQFRLPRLPWKISALEPYMSEKSLEIHHGKLHAGYVTHLNTEIAGTIYEDMILEEIIKNTSHILREQDVYPVSKASKDYEKKLKAIYKNAAQHFNHSFFWQCLTPDSHKIPDNLNKQIAKSFGSVTDFKHQFTETALSMFGSGWTWLVQNSMQNDVLFITNGTNADNPLINGNIPLLCLDMWEHSYFLDWKSNKKEYLENFWYICNYEFINSNLK